MRAVIEWVSKENGGRSRPPSGEGPYPYSPIIRFVDEPWPAEVAWSLGVWKIAASSDVDRWIADVEFRVDEAPHDRLREGREFELYEGNKCVARGQIIGDVILAKSPDFEAPARNSG